MNRILIAVLLLYCNITLGQNITGTIISERTKKPVEYVNIGLAGKNIGTVSDANGKFTIAIDSQFDNDSLLFSSIGYDPISIKITDLRKNNITVSLKEKIYELGGVIVKPKKFVHKVLGITTHSKVAMAGFKDNFLGYEMGILMKVKKSAVVKKVNLNISACSFDTIFYRLNIYKVTGDNSFENILNKPIYINIPKDKIKEKIEIDLQPYNIVVDGDFLVTIEHIKNMGDGYLYFCAGLAGKTHYRKTSQGEWQTAPVGVSISVDADVEK